jgi:lysophospholipase L1-like esterase
MAQRPKVLLIGDSQRGIYKPVVAEILGDTADVVAPGENCAHTLITLAALPRWVTELGTPDVVHWNNGLHDVGHNPNRAPVQFPLEMYIGNLGHILRALQDLKVPIIWATTTPVHRDRPWDETTWSWRNEEIDRYNQAALELLAPQVTMVNDLYGVVAADPDQYIAEDKLHLSEAGAHQCAEAVASSVRQALHL